MHFQFWSDLFPFLGDDLHIAPKIYVAITHELMMMCPILNRSAKFETSLNYVEQQFNIS